jgi:hypothetical protein
MSLDGYVAGRSQSMDNPLGIGGMRLHWAGPFRSCTRLWLGCTPTTEAE